MDELHEENGPETYEVIISPTALEAISTIASRADRARIDKVLSILDTVPGIGRTYDPVYEAARPKEPVMVAYAGHYSIYYEVSDDRGEVHIYYIEDQRRDPLSRFSARP
ncbi:hypothetical protein H8S61_15650 [Eggerthella sp. NSJ-70]|uniref:Type II toxin-antitoxin system RelE/ParE family toxin n=1 Tax=Eggerthella hominis TaxID=2763043 RepID=A0ABR7BVK5_9ACTN|nr:hypothetical protein [Eggerthella hominis]MBC5585620.1 hypothetical protein [Eggerthella hominis]